ncbi:MAG: metallophosphoesterase family protein [Marinilabiliaceae bacterium]|nr:metallophosphoesterase family protein [Marinilabiliaceae bacterium]
MIRIGLLSDTHSFFDPRFFELFKDVDEIWHVGDIGSEQVLDQMESFRPVRAVYGNIDNAVMRRRLKEVLRFKCEGVDVLMIHIGGYPGNYDRRVKSLIEKETPKLFISGHSHILKVIFDKKNDMLHINPGAAGKNGFHAIRTAIRFCIDNEKIKDLEVIELGRKNGIITFPE